MEILCIFKIVKNKIIKTNFEAAEKHGKILIKRFRQTIEKYWSIFETTTK